MQIQEQEREYIQKEVKAITAKSAITEKIQREIQRVQLALEER